MFLRLLVPILLIAFPCFGSTTYSVIDIETGKEVTAKENNQKQILASLTKLPTYAFALKVLGGDFRFLTTLSYDGKIKKSTLNGNLHITGEGDPYFTLAHLYSLIDAIKVAGIKIIKGKIIYHTPIIKQVSRLSPIGLQDQADNPTFGALNVEFNRFNYYRHLKSTLPKLDSISMTMKSFSGPTDLKFKNSSPGQSSDEWYFSPKARLKYRESLPSRNAQSFYSSFFRKLIKLSGIQVENSNIKEGKLTNLYTHKGIPLSELAALGVEYSNNLLAELPLLRAAYKLKKRSTSLEEAGKLMKEWLSKEYNLDSFMSAHFVNGSGLTIDNRVSATQYSTLLSKVSKEIYQGRSFQSLLSINCHSGWIKDRIFTVENCYKVRAKTGALHYVQNIGGFFYGNSGKQYAFTILSVDKEKRALLNKEGKDSPKLREESKDWANEKKEEQDRLLSKWIATY